MKFVEKNNENAKKSSVAVSSRTLYLEFKLDFGLIGRGKAVGVPCVVSLENRFSSKLDLIQPIPNNLFANNNFM